MKVTLSVYNGTLLLSHIPVKNHQHVTVLATRPSREMCAGKYLHSRAGTKVSSDCSACLDSKQRHRSGSTCSKLRHLKHLRLRIRSSLTLFTAKHPNRDVRMEVDDNAGLENCEEYADVLQDFPPLCLVG